MLKKKQILSIIIVLSLLFGVLNIGMFPTTASDNITITKWQDKITPELYEVMEKSKKDELIPVYIWYTDIDHEEVKEQVKNQTGLTEDNISVDYNMPDDAVLDGIAELGSDELKNVDTDFIQTEMKTWLEITENSRNAERERAEFYSTTKREISKEMYNEKSTNLLCELKINNNDVIYNSEYAPMVCVELTVDEIISTAKNTKIELLDYIADKIGNIDNLPWLTNLEKNDLTFTLESTGIGKAYSIIGLKGKNVRIGLADGHVTNKSLSTRLTNSDITVVGPYQPTLSDYDNQAQFNKFQKHANEMAELITYFFAPETKLFSTSVHYCKNNETLKIYSNIESLISNGVKIINMSYGWERGANDWYSIMEKWFDHITAQHGVIFVKSAGNHGDIPINEPGLSYNAITVGLYDNLSLNPNNHYTWHGESSFNNGNGCFKPDTINPGIMVGTTQYEGTSSAAAITTAMISLILDMKPSLANYPQAIKAIVLASSHRKVKVAQHGTFTTESIYDGLTTRQGVGPTNIFNALCIVGKRQYGIGQFTGTEDNRYFYPRVNSGSNSVNVSLTWLQENIINGNCSTTNPTVGTVQDVDLYVYRGADTNPVGLSTKSNSSTEMAYFNLNSLNEKYRIKIDRYSSNNSNNIRYGYAWSENNIQFTPPSNQGIYYIRNKATNLYLNMNTANRQLTQTAYSGSTNQQWIVMQTSSGYRIKTANTSTIGGIARGSNSPTANIQYADVKLSGFLNSLDFVERNDGTVDIYQADHIHNRLQPYQSLNSSGAQMAFYQFSSSSNHQRWYLEPINYLKGDLDSNGIVNITDQNIMNNYILGSTSLTDLQISVADMNNDGIINGMDLLLIQKRINGTY